MKTIKILATAVTLALFVGGSLLAQDDAAKTQNKLQTQQKVETQTQMNNDGTPMGRGMNFVDEDGNGICDRFESGQRMGKKAGSKMGQGRNFIDEDGDGVCDNRGSGRMHKGRGHGNGSGNGHRGNGSMNQGWNR